MIIFLFFRLANSQGKKADDNYFGFFNNWTKVKISSEIEPPLTYILRRFHQLLPAQSFDLFCSDHLPSSFVSELRPKLRLKKKNV